MSRMALAVLACLAFMGLPAIAAATDPAISFATLPALQATTPIPGSSHVPNDFNGDGLSDLLWFNPATSQMAYWVMATGVGQVERVSYRTFHITPGYFVAATGDLNGDGLADLVFTDAQRHMYLWMNNGRGGFVSRFLDTYPEGWLPVGAGDVDGDGQDDLLWLNKSACKFGYWSMRNGVRTGSRVIPITCGYYPLSIGYYTPGNRLSIVWTSAALDLYAWDGSGSGFHSFPLGTHSQYLIAFGGGFAGADMSLMNAFADDFDPRIGTVSGGSLTRTYDASLNQVAYEQDAGWLGGASMPLGSAGFIIQGQGVNRTGLIFQQGPEKIDVCPPVGQPYLYQDGPAPMPTACPAFTYPAGWYMVGAMANGVAH